MTLGDVLILLSLALTWLVYWLGRAASTGRDLGTALALLRAVQSGMPWGALYFGSGYDAKAVDDRARQEYETVLHGSYGQVFHVPTEPLAALVANPAAGGLVRRATVEAASVALWQLGVFNQLVRQQTDFNARHLAELYDDGLPPQRRETLAKAASAHSRMLHANGIGDAHWYQTLMRELATNIDLLNAQLGRPWWTRPFATLAIREHS